MRLGWGIGVDDAGLVLRSLPSMPLRYRAHDASARALARWLQDRPRDGAGAASRAAPDRRATRTGARCAATMAWPPACSRSCCTSAIRRPRRSIAFCDALALFKLGYSWAGPVSLVVPYDIGHAPRRQLAASGHAGALLDRPGGAGRTAGRPRAGIARSRLTTLPGSRRFWLQWAASVQPTEGAVATPNYGYEKRQKELAKKRKKEDKLRAKADRKAGVPAESEEGQPPQDGEAVAPDAAPPRA